MLVITETVGESVRNERSYSSASTTKRRSPPNRRFPPQAGTRPPTRPVGSSEDQFEIFGLVENLFDTDPPIAPGTTGSVVQSSYPTNPALFDTLGARFRTGVRARF